MKVRKAIVIIRNGASNEIHSIDVVEYQGKFWLVPAWLDYPAQKATRPLRIVWLGTMRHHHMPGSDPEFLVEDPVPSYVFDGRLPPEEASRYVVVESPELVLPRDESKH